MMRLLPLLISLLFLRCTPAHAVFSDTLNTIPQPGAQFNEHNQTFHRQEDADRFHETICKDEFVYSGCLAEAVPALTHTPSDCTAYARGYRIRETGSIAYPANSTCWVVYDRHTTGDLVTSVTWSRVLGTHYLVACGPTTAPTRPDDAGWMMKVVTDGTAITTVTDLRDTTLPGGCDGGTAGCFQCVDLAGCDLCPLVEGCFDNAIGAAGDIFCVVTDPLYGAIPDDGLDDTAAFQKAFNDCANYPLLSTEDCGASEAAGETEYNFPGIVYVPKGVYDICNVTEDLTFDTGTLFSNGVSLWGDGPEASVLRCLTHLGSCDVGDEALQGRSCNAALQMGNGACYAQASSFVGGNGFGGASIRGIGLVGPAGYPTNSSRGLRLTNTEGLRLYEEQTGGFTIDNLSISGFDTGLFAPGLTQLTLRASEFRGNFDHLYLSGGRIESVTFGAAGRANVFVNTDEGIVDGAFVNLLTAGNTPYGFYQSTRTDGSFVSGEAFLSQTTIDNWYVQAVIGNALFWSELADHTGDANLFCTGADNPYPCCTGLDTGTCVEWGGALDTTTVRIRMDTNAATNSFLATEFIPLKPRYLLGQFGTILGKNEWDVRAVHHYLPGVPNAAGSPIHFRFRDADAVGGLRLHNDDPTTTGVVLVDATNFARVRGCDNIETCATLATVTTTTTTSTTTTTLAAGEWCGNPSTIAAGGGVAAGTLVGKSNDHDAGAVTADAPTALVVDETLDGGDVVYSWTPSVTGFATADTCLGSANGMNVSVRSSPCHYTGVDGAGEGRSEGQTIARCVDGNDDRYSATGGATICSTGLPGSGCKTRFAVTAGQTYYLLVDIDAGNENAYSLTVTSP